MTDQDSSNERPRTRAELYELIRETSKEEVILDGMVRHGFWPAQSEKPEDPPDDVHRMAQLERELRELRTNLSKNSNAERALKQARKARMEASRQRQRETKERRAKEREERAKAWAKRKKTEVIHVGKHVSLTLDDLESHDRSRLRKLKLPHFKDPLALAKAIGISLSELRFLSYSRPVSSINHYQRFNIPKKTGGLRTISAPMPRLKNAQHWILQNILSLVPVHTAAHGFRHQHSIVTNAQPHTQQALVVNIDLQDFFPSITLWRVQGMFQHLGYSPAISTLLALLCTEPDTLQASIDNRSWFISQGPRRLPQGAPTSPAITNIICRRLDKRLHHFAQSFGFNAYTRYADDLTFSGDDTSFKRKKAFLETIQEVVQDEGFTIHPKKTRIQRKGRRQEVTGLIVNERVNVPRAMLRRMRATLHQISLDGPEGKTWEGASGDQLFHALEGYASFVHMVDPAKGKPLLDRVRKLRDIHEPTT